MKYPKAAADVLKMPEKMAILHAFSAPKTAAVFSDLKQKVEKFPTINSLNVLFGVVNNMQIKVDSWVHSFTLLSQQHKLLKIHF